MGGSELSSFGCSDAELEGDCVIRGDLDLADQLMLVADNLDLGPWHVDDVWTGENWDDPDDYIDWRDVFAEFGQEQE